MKVIALYLPQYHNVPENDVWWGKGYTEWTSLKRGRKYVEGQYQPRVPLNENYYDLTDIKVMKWQVDIAKQYGIYGFCVYHYWFNGHLILEKPMEQFLSHKEIDFPFFFCWANERWTTIWEGAKEPKVLIEQDYSKKVDVIEHFRYFQPFFLDKRYMKIDNKPIVNILNPITIPYKDLYYLYSKWNEMAKEIGFDGIYFLYQSEVSLTCMDDKYRDLFEKGIEYQPALIDYTGDPQTVRKQYKKSFLKHWIANRIPAIKFMHSWITDKRNSAIEKDDQNLLSVLDYDDEWNKILSIQHKNFDEFIPGGFVDWDNTPRRGKKGKVILGASPEKFKQYFGALIDKAKSVYKTDMVVLFAWNEWSEGGYMEPDEKWKYGYLEAIKSELIKKKELPYELY